MFHAAAAIDGGDHNQPLTRLIYWVRLSGLDANPGQDSSKNKSS